jgi:hypothetical protein
MKKTLAILIALFATVAFAQTTVNQGQGSLTVTPWRTQGSNSPTAIPNQVVLPSYQRGAFGAVFVESETLEIHLQFPYAINPRLVTTTVANGGTVTATNNLATLQTTANIAGASQFQSNLAIKYSPGQGIITRFTAIFSTCVVNNVQEIGLGNTVDGFFFTCDPTTGTFGINRRRGGVDSFVAQSAWNGDRFNGAGGTVNPSGQTLAITNGNVYMIDFQWLGFGAIRFFAENPLTGEPILVHTIRYSNSNTLPSIFNPSLPLSARTVNTGNATNITLQTASMGAATQGPRNDVGLSNGFTNVKTGVTTADTNIFTLQNRATFNGATNRTRIRLTSVSVAVTAGASAKIVLNGTEGGAPVFTDISTTQSVAAVDVAGTTVTVGSLVFPLATSFDQVFNLETLNLRLNPGETFNFSCASETGTVTCRIGASWREEF